MKFETTPVHRGHMILSQKEDAENGEKLGTFDISKTKIGRAHQISCLDH